MDSRLLLTAALLSAPARAVPAAPAPSRESLTETGHGIRAWLEFEGGTPAPGARDQVSPRQWHREALAHFVRALELDPGNRHAARWLQLAIARLTPVALGLPSARLHVDSALILAVAPAGDAVLVARDEQAQLVDLATGQVRSSPIVHARRVLLARFSADGTHVATVDIHGGALVTNLVNGRGAAIADGRSGLTRTAIRLTTDGARFAALAWDGDAVYVGDSATGKVEHTLGARGLSIDNFDLNPTCTLVAASDGKNDATAYLWDLRQSRRLTRHRLRESGVSPAIVRFGLEGRVLLLLDPRGQRYALRAVESGRTIDSGSAEHFFTSDAEGLVRFVAGGRLVATYEGGQTHLRHTASGRRFGEAIRGTSMRGTVSPDGRLYAETGVAGHQIRLVDLTTGSDVLPPIATAKLDEARPDTDIVGGILSLSWTPDGDAIVAQFGERTVLRFDLPVDDAAALPLFHSSHITEAAFDPRDERVVIAGLDGRVSIFEAGTGLPLLRTEPRDDSVWAVGWSPDGRHLAVGGSTSAWLLDARTGQPVGAVMRPPDGENSGQHYVQALAFSPDGNALAVGSWDGCAQLFDAHNGAPRCPPWQHAGPVAPAFIDDGRVVLTAGAKEARRHRVADCAELGPPLPSAVPGWTALNAGPFAIETSAATERVLLTATGNATAVFTAAGELVGRTPPDMAARSVAHFSADGRRFAVAHMDGSARVWRGDALTQPLFGVQHGSGADDQTDAAFSPDGSLLVTSQLDSARLWDSATGRVAGPTLPIGGPGSARRATSSRVRFSHDGRRLLIFGDDSTVAGIVAVPTDAELDTPVPASVLNWARGVAGLTFGADGDLQRLWLADRLRLLGAVAALPGPWRQLADRLAAPPSARLALPGAGPNRAQLVRQAIEADTRESLEFAIAREPGRPLLGLLLARAIDRERQGNRQGPRDATCCEHLRAAGLGALPRTREAAALWASAAALLADRPELAGQRLAAARTAVRLDPTLPAAREALAAAESAMPPPRSKSKETHR